MASSTFNLFTFSLIFSYYCLNVTEGVLKRCYVCRSRGELGSCKDPFTFNSTQAEEERGIELRPCASGWCGKIVESENDEKEEYGLATQRMCFQRGPPDNEDRCAYTKYQTGRVFMCFCRGDLCNSSWNIKFSVSLLIPTIIIVLYRFLV